MGGGGSLPGLPPWAEPHAAPIPRPQWPCHPAGTGLRGRPPSAPPKHSAQKQGLLASWGMEQPTQKPEVPRTSGPTRGWPALLGSCWTAGPEGLPCPGGSPLPPGPTPSLRPAPGEGAEGGEPERLGLSSNLSWRCKLGQGLATSRGSVTSKPGQHRYTFLETLNSDWPGRASSALLPWALGPGPAAA